MARLFVDTWGWLSLRDQEDLRHEAVEIVFRGAAEAEGAPVTTDYVLDETFTLFFRRLKFSQARESVDSLMAAVREGSISLESVNPARFAEAV